MKHVKELFLYYKDTTFFADFQVFRQLYYDTIGLYVDTIGLLIDKMRAFFRSPSMAQGRSMIWRPLGETPQTPRLPPTHPVGGIVLNEF